MNITIEELSFYKEMSEGDKSKFKSSLMIRTLDKNQIMMGDNNRCTDIPIVLSGNLKLFRVSENGREIGVYNVKAGEICILAAICVLADYEYDFTAEAQTECRLAVIPIDVFHDMIGNCEPFKRYIFKNLADKLITSLNTIEMLNFSSIASRIKTYLRNNADEIGEVIATHGYIARDIGSSREVISRELKKLEKQGFIQLKRGRIIILEKCDKVTE